MSNTRPLLKGIPWFLALVLFASIASSCALVEQVQELRAQRQVPKELSTLWEVYQTVKAKYAGKEELHNDQMAVGAVQGMLGTLGPAADISFLSESDYDSEAPDLGGVWQAWRIISGHLKETGAAVTPQQLQEGAIRGMLRAIGNPYTAYLNPSSFILEEQNLHSTFEGIGAWVDLVDGKLTIVALIPDSPAEEAGIMEGDVLLQSDSTPLEGLTRTEAVLLIRGPRGTPVDLLVQRSGVAEPLLITVIRDTVEQPSVLWQPVTTDIVYLQITDFLDNTGERLKEALLEVQEQGYKGLVLDLRGNPGGLLSSTVTVASQFLEDGLVLYHIDAKDKRKEFAVQRGGVALDLSLVVLANGSSASGSEVLVGALQDHERAIFVGTRTFGKGSVNELRRLADGSGLYITSALWYTPSGRLIEGVGLEPDVEVLNERVLIRNQRGQLAERILDRQLEYAVAMLEAEFAQQSPLAS
ncbi:MAG: S41 family peptidase [Chloroflexi bacterium]|nr:S41 family peptidase [Chloroflexota bacterium]